MYGKMIRHTLHRTYAWQRLCDRNEETAWQELLFRYTSLGHKKHERQENETTQMCNKRMRTSVIRSAFWGVHMRQPNGEPRGRSWWNICISSANTCVPLPIQLFTSVSPFIGANVAHFSFQRICICCGFATRYVDYVSHFVTYEKMVWLFRNYL